MFLSGGDAGDLAGRARHRRLAAELPRKPAGLADLLRMLTQYVAEVPAAERYLPPSLVRLAEAKGSTKSHAEARRLVRPLEAT